MTDGPLIACCWLPGLPLRVMAHAAGVGLDGPVALASETDGHPVVLDRSEAAALDGVDPGMLVSRAMGCCGALEVLGCDVPRIEAAGDRFVERLEALGAAVQPMEPGRAFFDAAPLVRMYGGLEGVVREVLGAYRGHGVRVGIGPNPFVARVVAQGLDGGGSARVSSAEARGLLAGMPLEVLPAGPELLRFLHALGLGVLGDVAKLAPAQVADRLGADGLRLCALARGEDDSRLEPRVSEEPVVERLAFPEPVGLTGTLASAVRMLASQLVEHPRCVQHAPRALVVTCVLAGGGTWRARRVLRVPTVVPERLALAIEPALAELPGAVELIELALDGFEPRAATQRTLLDGRGGAVGGDGGERGVVDGLDDERVRRGMRHVQATLGEGALLQVLEVEPWSRVPERHAVLVPRRVGAEVGT